MATLPAWRRYASSVRTACRSSRDGSELSDALIMQEPAPTLRSGADLAGLPLPEKAWDNE
ncbi:MAG: hypothetical protein ACYC7B_04370 [Burkholderiales bacterium]